MTYQETTDYLFNCYPVFEHVGKSAYKEGLDNSISLDQHLGQPHRSYPIIHIAGTNGKGSCSHTIAAILQSAGYKVGLYTSPHLVDFRERIRVNGQPISEQRVIDFVAEHRSFFEPLHPSFFELTTALAFLYFKEMQVDVAVIEVGLGGRLDCTNIITPVLSVITNISFDHTQFLGNTIAQIAAEKAGIIKQGKPVVIGESNDETAPVFTRIAAERNAPIIWAEHEAEVEQCEVGNDGQMRYHTKHLGTLTGQLGGSYQAKNTNTILAAIACLRSPMMGSHTLHIKDEDIRQGMSHLCEMTGLMGRWQLLRKEPRVICDTGHNLAGWQYLSRQLKDQTFNRLHMVFGMVDDKDIESVMQLLPRKAIYYWTQASTKRAIPSEQVAETGRRYDLEGKTYPSVHLAYQAALKNADADDLIFVGGSSYIVADVLSINDF